MLFNLILLQLVLVFKSRLYTSCNYSLTPLLFMFYDESYCFTRYLLVDSSQQGRSFTNRLTKPGHWLSDRTLPYLLIEPSEFLRRIKCSVLDASSFAHAIFNKSATPSLNAKILLIVDTAYLRFG